MRKIICTVILACLAMYFVEVYIEPEYFVKSIIKLGFFTVFPLLIYKFDRGISIKECMIEKSKKHIFIYIGLGIIVYGFVLGAYFLIREFIDLENIKTQLGETLKVTKSNFIFVALYIAVINSFIEEFFFRGFAFLSLEKVANKKLSYIFSAAAFAIYHVAIMNGWFNTFVYVALIIGLFGVGLLFNWINLKSKNIYSSWIIHLFANLAINTIGLKLFSII